MMSGLLSNAFAGDFFPGHGASIWDDDDGDGGSPVTSSDFSDPELGVIENFATAEQGWCVFDYPAAAAAGPSDCGGGGGQDDTRPAGGGCLKPRGGRRLTAARSAANQRERRRMKTINDAFETLRERIPTPAGVGGAAPGCGGPQAAGPDGRKLSKVDTLKLAIRYIQHLSEVLSACEDPRGRHPGGGGGRGGQEKVVLRCHVAAFTDCMQVAAEFPIYGHSLSWSKTTPSRLTPDNRMRTRLWVPAVGAPAGGPEEDEGYTAAAELMQQ